MCDVGAFVQAGLTMVQMQQQDDLAKKNADIAGAAANNANTLLGLRAEQEQRAGIQTIYQMDLQARKADAQTRVQAGESGVAGASVDALLADVERQRLMADTGTKTNVQNTMDQIAQQRQVVATTKQANIAQVQGSNPWAGGIKIGGSLLEAGGQAYKNSQQGASSSSAVMNDSSSGSSSPWGSGSGSKQTQLDSAWNEGGD